MTTNFLFSQVTCDPIGSDMFSVCDVRLFFSYPAAHDTALEEEEKRDRMLGYVSSLTLLLTCIFLSSI